MTRACTIAILSATVTAALAGCGESAPPKSTTVTVAGAALSATLALDEPAREKGLSGRESIGHDEAMLFVFPDSQTRNFWMVDCLMDIDIAFIDPFGFVTAVHTMPKEPLQAQGETRDDYYRRLRRYPSVDRAQYALEVAPGRLAELGVQRGTRLEFDRDTLKRLAQ